MTLLKIIQLLPVLILLTCGAGGGYHKMNLSNKQNVLAPTAYKALSRPC